MEDGAHTTLYIWAPGGVHWIPGRVAELCPGVAWAAGSRFAGTAGDRFESGLAALLDGITRRAGRA